MSDTTHEAPERIWAEPDGGELHVVHNSAPNLDAFIATGYLTEYVRADLVHAAVAAALREAHDAIAEYPRVAPDEAEAQHYDEQIDHSQSIILALIPDGGAALDRYVEQVTRGGATNA